MKELKPSGLIAIEVPEHAMGAVTYQSEYSDKYVLRWIDDIINIVDLPKGKWELIGSVTAEHIDFDPASVVESWKSTMPYDFDGYDVYPIQHMDYMDGFFKSSFSAYDSLRSLLTANDVHFVNPYELKGAGHYENVQEYFSQQEKWLEAESKLVEKILILKPL